MFVFCSPEATGVWSNSKSWAGGREGGRGGEGGALGGGVKCTIIAGDFFFFTHQTASDGASCPCALTFSDVMQIC